MTMIEQPVSSQLAVPGTDMYGTLAKWMRANCEQLEDEYVATIHTAADLAGRASCGACVEIVEGHDTCRDSFYVMSGVLAGILNDKVAEEETRAQKERRMAMLSARPRNAFLPRSVDLWTQECTTMRLNGVSHFVTQWLNLHADTSLIQREGRNAAPVLTPIITV